MTFSKTFTTKPEHIDCQGIMDGLYYPFYMEQTRHQYAREVLKFNLEEQAQKGVNMILTEYTIKFKKSLIKDDKFEVDCSAEIVSPIKVKFIQTIKRDGKLITSGEFFATCINASGGRPFIPDEVKNLLNK